MTHDETLTYALNFLSDNPAGMKDHARIAREVRYARKLKFEPLSKFSTVFSRRYCRLAYNWKDWTDQTPQPVKCFAQVASLVHEATHCMQRDGVGDVSFNASYLFTDSSRFRFECEGYGAQAKYFRAFFGMSLSQTLPYYEMLGQLLADHYLLASEYTKERCTDGIIAASNL